jgi:hypothetical protein
MEKDGLSEIGLDNERMSISLTCRFWGTYDFVWFSKIIQKALSAGSARTGGFSVTQEKPWIVKQSME